MAGLFVGRQRSSSTCCLMRGSKSPRLLAWCSSCPPISSSFTGHSATRSINFMGNRRTAFRCLPGMSSTGRRFAPATRMRTTRSDLIQRRLSHSSERSRRTRSASGPNVECACEDLDQTDWHIKPPTPNLLEQNRGETPSASAPQARHPGELLCNEVARAPAETRAWVGGGADMPEARDLSRVPGSRRQRAPEEVLVEFCGPAVRVASHRVGVVGAEDAPGTDVAG